MFISLTELSLTPSHMALACVHRNWYALGVFLLASGINANVKHIS